MPIQRIGLTGLLCNDLLACFTACVVTTTKPPMNTKKTTTTSHSITDPPVSRSSDLFASQMIGWVASRHSWFFYPCSRTSTFVPPLPVGNGFPVVSRSRTLLDLVALAQPATGLATPADLLPLAESARLLVAGTGSIQVPVHKPIVSAPYT